MWTDYLSPSPSVGGTFGDHPPELKGLKLLRMVLREKDTVLFLDFSSLPPNAPKRWHERKVILQIRFILLEAKDVEVASQRDWDLCSVLVKKGSFTVLSNASQTLYRSSYSELFASFLPSQSQQQSAEYRDRHFDHIEMEDPRRQP